MFWLIRLIFIIFLLGIGYSWCKWKASNDPKWRRHFTVLLSGTLTLAIFIVIVLILTRLLR